jgi:hypothetical protein
MTVNIYVRWDGLDDEKHEEHFQFFGPHLHGYPGFIREVRTRGHSVTRYLVPELADGQSLKVRAEVLRQRLPNALQLAEGQQLLLKELIEFVELCEQMEKHTGSLVTVVAP